MELCKLTSSFSICKLKSYEGLDIAGEFVFFSKTDNELSLVCEEAAVPRNALAVESGYSAFRIPGQLDFGMVGVIAGITEILAKAGISVFVISTYDTDYILIKEQNLEKAEHILENVGWNITKLL